MDDVAAQRSIKAFNRRGLVCKGCSAVPLRPLTHRLGSGPSPPLHGRQAEAAKAA